MFEEALQKWLERVQNIAGGQLEIDSKGKKYIKIIKHNAHHQSVYCFIEKSTGNVLKAASWNAPAKHPRGNIYKEGEEGVDRFGAQYLRG